MTILTLDNGGTFTKAVLYDENGSILSKDQQSIETIIEGKKVSRCHHQVWQQNIKAIRNVLVGQDSSQIRVISISGHGKGLYYLGKHGQVIGPSILSTDQRARDIVHEWKQTVFSRVKDKILQDLFPCQIPILLTWLKREEPQIYRQIHHIFGIKDYLRYCLTGAAHAEIGDFSGSGMVNLRTKAYDEKLFEAYGLIDIRHAFPPLIDSLCIGGYVHERASKETGIPTGVPVIGGLFDIDAMAIGLRGVEKDTVTIVGGTWGIHEYVSSSPDPSVSKNSIFPGGQYLVEVSSPTSASNLQWFIERFLAEKKNEFSQLDSFYEVLNEMVERTPLSMEGPIFLPHLYGSPQGAGRAAWLGLTGDSTREDLLRAIYEGVAFTHRLQLEELEKNHSFSICRLGGGIANSDIWVEILASILNKPIERVDSTEPGTYGAFIAAKAALGDWSLEEGMKKCVGISRRVMPNPSWIHIYEQKYELYKKVLRAFDVIDSIFAEKEAICTKN